MFQACEVKIAKTAAHSALRIEPGEKPEEQVTGEFYRKPKIGTDCRTSSNGMRTSAARRLLAASVA